MKDFCKKISQLLFCIAMAQNVVLANNGSIIATTVHDGMCYNILSDETATLFGNLEEFGGNPNFTGSYVIPEQVEYNGKIYTVDCINGAFGNIKGLTSLVIPKTVIMVATSFSYCPALKQIIFEDGDQSLDLRIPANYGCEGSAIESIYIGRPINNYAGKFLHLGGSTLK